MSNELLATIGRLRRTMLRNGDVLEVCGALEKLLTQASSPAPKTTTIGPGFDRTSYQRDYMRRYRAKTA